MSSPISVDVPHRLGQEEARRRIDANIDKLKDSIPGGAAVRSGWDGDQLGLNVVAMGQEVNARLDVRDSFVRVEVVLPPALSFFKPIVEKALASQTAGMLEDKR